MTTIAKRVEAQVTDGAPLGDVALRDALALRDVLKHARAVCEDHWSNDSGKVQRSLIRALEAALSKAGA